MQTSFSLAQLADPDTKEADKILRACVHCGFCTATCPTYVLIGDEDDSPRGRIYLIKEMLEQGRAATKDIVKHIDRCLSCLACMTTCPSGVHYMHLVDHARDHIEKTYRRPLFDKMLRALLAWSMPYNDRFRVALVAGRLGKPFAGLLRGLGLKRIAALLTLTPRYIAPPPHDAQRAFPAIGARRKRVAMLSGCINPVIAPHIRDAAIRLLNRFGTEVVIAEGEGCCGSLVHHMGKEEQAHALARANIDAWTREIDKGLDAILVTVSGCGTTIKDYGFMFRNDPDYAAKAAKVSALAKDITEYLYTVDMPSPQRPPQITIAYHSACSLQHGQKITREPKALLVKMGFNVKDVPEAHLCCGSAGTYNLLQPEIAQRLRDRKVANIESTRPDAIAAGNIGCIMQISSGTGIPVVHTAELLDWATGGPRPPALDEHNSASKVSMREPEPVG
jgi:glycolate oxidase iron-sulfur subunit